MSVPPRNEVIEALSTIPTQKDGLVEVGTLIVNGGKKGWIVRFKEALDRKQ